MDNTTKAVGRNRDRFFEKINPFFDSSEYTLKKPEKGKYKDKIIQIMNDKTGEHEIDLWCHVRNDRLDILITDKKAAEIPEELGLQTNNQNIALDRRLGRQKGKSYQFMNEETLVEICKFIADSGKH